MSFPITDNVRDGPIHKKYKRSSVNFASALLSQRLTAMSTRVQNTAVPIPDPFVLEDEFDYLEYHGIDKSEWIPLNNQEDLDPIYCPYEDESEHIVEDQEDDTFTFAEGN